MKVVELFAGVGGFRLGMERAGHEVVWANEWDKYACDTYDKNFGGKNIDRRDITTVAAGDIPEHDIICGGFPCQTFSVAGKRRGFDEARGTLFFEIMRIAKHHRTKYLFLENVKGLLSHDGGRTFEVILEALDELGYDAQWQVLNSKNFGVPQNRERIIIIGHLRSEPRPEVFPLGESDGNSVIQVNQPTHSNDRIYDPAGLSPTLNTMQGGRQPFVALAPFAIQDVRGMNKKQNGRGYKLDSSESYTVDAMATQGVAISYNRKDGVGKELDVAYTLNSGDYRGLNRNQGQTAVTDGYRIRRLTPVECERLQGFPDGWTAGVSDTQRYKQMGNAVTTNVIEAVAERLPMTVQPQ